MAEILAVVASGMGVASLAMQVASSVKKLKDFCDRVKDTPSEIHDTLDDIEILSIVIDEIEAMAKSGSCLPRGLHTALLRSAKRCLEASNQLRSIVSEIEEAIQKRKFRGAMKGALRRNKLDEIRQRLESAKMTCLLAGQSHQRQQHERTGTSILLLQQTLQTYSKLLPYATGISSSPPEECSATGYTSMESAVTPYYSYSKQNKSFWGSYKVRRIAKPFDKNMPGSKVRDSSRKVFQTLISAQLPYWSFRRRFDLYTSRSHSGWDFSLNIYNVRPSDAPVFQHVRDGNISAVQHLFKSNVASVFDVDLGGKSLLHYAIYPLKLDYAICGEEKTLQLETLKFLLECGAPLHVRDRWGYSPLLYLLFCGQDICFKSSQSDNFRQAIQYLLDYGSCPYTEQTNIGTTSLESYSGSEEGHRLLLNSFPLQALSSEDFDVLNTLHEMLYFWTSNTLQLIRNLLPNGKLNTMTEERRDVGIINCSMKYLCDPKDGWLAFMEELLDTGADIHGYWWADDIRATPLWHLLNSNATILAYSTSPERKIRTIEDTMTSWLGILERCGYNISDYLAEEEHLREVYGQPLPDTLARVEIKFPTREMSIEREWAYLWREFDSKSDWDFSLDIPERHPDKYRLEAFWRYIEEELETGEFVPGDLKMPGSWEE